MPALFIHLASIRRPNPAKAIKSVVASDRSRREALRTQSRLTGASNARRSSLRSKLVLSLAVMFLAALSVNEIIARSVVAPQLLAMQQLTDTRDSAAVQESINGEVAHINELTRTWAKQLASDTESPWSDREVLWACVVSKDEAPNWLYGPQFSSETAIVQVVEGVGKLGETNDSDHELKRFAGIARIADQSLVMFASALIPTPDPIATEARLVVGRLIDQSVITRLRSQTQVDFTIRASESITEPGHIEVQVPRKLIERADQTFVVARYLFILGSVAALLSLLLMLQRIVIGPLDLIRLHLDQVAQMGLETEPLGLDSHDEIGDLSRAFDKMVVRLSEAQQQLSDASQASGRSEVAATVIHNVGNVLTNVNSLIDTVSERIDGLHFEKLQRLAQQLKNSDCAEGLLDATPGYLRGLATKWKTDQEVLSNLLATLDDNVRHIHDVIRDQQHHADRSIELKPVDLCDLIDEAIGCCRARLNEDSIEVHIARESGVVTLGDRSLLLQTVINVIGNARQAMRETYPMQRVLDIVASVRNETAVLELRDNGCGMDRQTLARVFEAHFTTNEGGTGLGLHFCANTVKRFGGTIQAKSAGHGLGSIITIELPCTGRQGNVSRNGTAVIRPTSGLSS